MKILRVLMIVLSSICSWPISSWAVPSAAEATTQVYVCGSADYRASYLWVDVSQQVAKTRAGKYCQQKSVSPRNCSAPQCKRFPSNNRKLTHAIVKFKTPLHAPSRPSSGGGGNSTPARPAPEPQPTPRDTSPRLCPDGKYHAGGCNLCPDGKYHGGDKCELGPDGNYHGGSPNLCPDGKYVAGNCTLCPDGHYHGGNSCNLAPDGKYHGDED